MPLTPRELPAPLHSGVFTLSEAFSAGLTDKELRHRRFNQPFRGLRSIVRMSTYDSRARAYSRLLRPGEAFSHETALLLLDCPIRVPQDQPLHLTAPHFMRARRGQGVAGHVSRYPFTPWSRADGVKVAPPLLALAQSAATLPLRELVVAIDSLVLPRRKRGPLVRLDTLVEDLCGYSGRGIRKLRHAVGVARVGAESRMETLLRLVLEAFGLAKHFELQVDLYDDEGWIGRFDLVCIRCKLVLEYDGEQHRTDQAQYLKDIRRLDRARDAGYRVIRVHVGELLSDPAQIARRVASALGVECIVEPKLKLFLPRPGDV